MAYYKKECYSWARAVQLALHRCQTYDVKCRVYRNRYWWVVEDISYGRG